MNTAIRIERLSKSFISRPSSDGLIKTLKNIFFAKKHYMQAIDNLSLTISHGERVAFIGPNGAGKSTLIKMLTGILYPTSGNIQVLGLTPWKERTALGYQIGTVFGQRSQLWVHLPALDTFHLLAKIYNLDTKTYKTHLQQLIELFDISHILNKPVKSLSLGERMRCEILASLLHKPKILFLDEPTIGLDINAKLIIRSLLNKLSKNHGTTLFLTSHDTADIEQVCDRVLVLDKGLIITDSSVKELKKTFSKKKIVTLISDTEQLNLQLPGVKILENASYHLRCELDTSITPIDKIIQETSRLTTLKDITIEDPSMEEILRLLYQKKTNA